MSFLLKYWIPAQLIFFLGIGLSLSSITKLAELKWYYIAGTPFIALMTGLVFNFLLDTNLNKELKQKAVLASLVVSALFVIAFFVHLLVYVNGTFRYKDVNGIKRTYVKGYKYTKTALRYKQEHSINSDAELLYEWFGGTDGINDVWTPSAIHLTTIHLIVSYCSSILFLSVLISWVLGTAYEKRFLEPQKILHEIMEEDGASKYEKYLLTFKERQTDEKYKSIKFHIFLSYASSERNLAEAVYYSLANNGHMVFFDRSSLPVGFEYNTAIHTAILYSDVFIFLISPESVAEGHYTLSELKFASEKWPSAKGRLLPVMCLTTSLDQIPAYAKSVTILSPLGNIVAEITTEVEKMYSGQ